MNVLCREGIDDICGNHQNRSIGSGTQLCIKGDLADDAGGGKHTKFARIKAKQCYLPSFFGEKISADPAGKDKQHSKTFIVTAVNNCAFFITADKAASAYHIFFLFGQG